jgi:calcineurin-like phosphoesterase family protein
MTGRVWFTSDTHFHHKAIIGYCSRPFPDVDAMAEGLIERWNAVVRQEDRVYHLGDFAFAGKGRSQPILDRLTGRKTLVRGNHDHAASKLTGWEAVTDYLEVKADGLRLVLCHFPFRVWNHVHHGAINLHGHSHGNLPGNRQQCDVGVDVWDYRPVSVEQIAEKLATLPPYSPADHHIGGSSP